MDKSTGDQADRRWDVVLRPQKAKKIHHQQRGRHIFELKKFRKGFTAFASGQTTLVLFSLDFSKVMTSQEHTPSSPTVMSFVETLNEYIHPTHEREQNRHALGHQQVKGLYTSAWIERIKFKVRPGHNSIIYHFILSFSLCHRN